MRSCSFSEAGVVVTVRFGLTGGTAAGVAAVWKRPMSPQAASVAATNSRAGAAQSWRLIPTLRRPANPSTSSYSSVWSALTRPSFLFEHNLRANASREGNRSPLFRTTPLVPAQHFDLPGPHHLDPWAGARLNPATNQNPPILQ